MPGITDLDVTYGGALAPAGFHRITRKDGGSGELNHGAAGSPSYLWYHEGVSKGQPVVEIAVLHDDEPVPQGFQKIARNLLKGVDQQAFLAVRRATDVDPIGKIHILFQDEEPADGYEKLSRSLNPASKVFIAFQRVSKDAPVKWSGYVLKTGDWVDARDTVNKWCVAQVVDAAEHTVTLHYKGWGSKWDESVPRDSPRLAELGTQTRGQDTGNNQRQQGHQSQWTAEDIAAMSRRVAAYLDGTETDEHFWMGDVPHFVETGLTSNFVNISVLPALNQFFQQMLDIVARELSGDQEISPNTMLMLNRLLDNDARCTFFYNNYGYGTNDDRAFSNSDFIIDGAVAKLTKQTAQEYSRLFVTNVNYFGKQGGFDAIRRRMEATYNPSTSLHQLQAFLSLLRTPLDIYKDSWAREYFNQVQSIVLGRLANLRNEEIKELQDTDIDVLVSIIGELEKILPVVLKDYPAAERLEVIHLQVGKRLLVCPYLSMRIKGMSILDEVVDMAKRREAPRTYATYTYSRKPLPVTKWITTSWLADWFAQEDVLDVALGDADALRRYQLDDTHVELVKRTEDLLYFLARYGKATSRHIDLLWAAGINQPDQQKRVVYKIISGIAPALDTEQLEYVGRRVHEAMASQPDELYVELVRGLAEGAYSKSGPVDDAADYGLNTLWSIAQDATSVPDAVRTLAAEGVAAVLSKPMAKRKLRQYSEQCVQQIVARQSPAFFVSLLQKLLDALLDVPSHANPMATKEQLINHLQEQHDLMRVVVTDLLSFLDDARQRQLKSDASTVERGFTFASALEVRLAFLRFILEASTLELRFTEVKQLWDSLVNNPFTPSDPNTFIAWLASICPEEYLHVQRRIGVYPCLSDTVVCDIFNELLGGGILSDEESGQLVCPFEKLDEDGYLCLEKFFRYVCGRQKRMQHSYNKLYFTVESAELPGFEVILEAFLRSTSEAVTKAASEFIVNLQIKLSPRLNRRVVWESFTHTCMELAQKDVSDQYRDRVLVILTKFLQEIKKPQTQQTNYVSAASGSRTDEQRLNVFWRKETTTQTGNIPGSRTVGYTFKRGTISIGALRARVARDLKHPVQQVRLLNGQRQSIPNSQDQFTLEQARVMSYIDAILLLKPEEDTSNYVPVTPAMTVEEDPNSDQMFPRKILSDDENCLALLFNMLSNPVVMNSAWSLLELLPTNTAMQEEIATLGGTLGGNVTAVNWNELLDSSRPLWLLYKLRIVADIISPLTTEGAAIADQDKARAWCAAFIQSAGVQHLLATLLAFDVQALCAGTLTKNCLAVLLQLLTQFLLPEDDVGEDSDPETPTPVAVAENDGVDSDVEDAGVVAVPVATVATASGQRRRQPDAIRSLSLDIDMASTMDAAQVSTTIRQLLAILHEISLSTDKPEDLEGGNAAKDSQRRNRQARIEEYYRTQATQGAQTSTAMDMIDWDNDDDETNNQSVELSLEAQVVRHAMSLLVAMTLNQPSVLDAVLQYPDLSDTLMYSLVKSPEGSLRSVVARGIIRLCERVEKDGQSPAHRFVTLLMPSLHMAREFPQSCFEFFALLAKLIVQPGALAAVDPDQLACDLAKQIIAHPVVEASEEEEDHLLRGTMMLLQNVLSAIPRSQQSVTKQAIGAELVDELFHQCLFAVPQRELVGGAELHPPKCKHSRTRAAAFGLLAELANNCAGNFSAVVTLVAGHHSLKAPARKSTKHSTVSLSSSYLFAKSKTGYAGLKNLGCICYMNSALQQFFMVPEFRQGVLDIEPSTDADLAKEDDVLAQLQDIFAHLQETEKAYFDPKGFCNAFKDWEGNPVDVLVQQDASEFLTMFFQNVEGLTMGSRSENLLKDCFGGMLSNELIAEGGKHSERGEPFSFISVPVQGNKNLYEALDQYTAGEMVDYTWETTDESGQVTKESLPTTKRVSIKTPPKHLIIHLKRFEFDFEHMQQIKINDRFEFPMDLDLYPYTPDGRAAAEGVDEADGEERASAAAAPAEGHDDSGDMVREYFKYELAGMVVHMGTANSGHYYSYIRERSGEAGGWFEFNDTYVGEFDPADIEDECFGGEEPVSYGYRAASGSSSMHSGQSNQAYTRQKIRNAFMLVYDRVAIKDDTQQQQQQNTKAVAPRYRANIPAHIMNELYEENLDFWRVKNIYDQRYYDFMQQLLTLDIAIPQDGATPPVDVVALATTFALGTLVHGRERMLLFQWAVRLSPILGNHVAASEWLLDVFSTDSRLLQDLLLGVSDKEIQSSVMTLLLAAIQALLPELAGTSGASKPAVLRFADSMMALLPVMQQQWRYIGLSFRPLVSLAEQSVPARQYMLHQGYLARLLSFFLNVDSPYPELVTGATDAAASKPKPMADSYQSADFLSTLELISALIVNCAFRDALPSVLASVVTPHYQPTDVEVEMSSLPVFLHRLCRELRNSHRKDIVAPIIHQLVSGRDQLSASLIDVIVHLMNKSDGFDLKPPLRAALLLVKVRDELEVRRTDMLMAAVVDEARENSKFVTATEVTANMFARLAKASANVRGWMRKNASSLAWLETFLQQRKQNLYPQGAMMTKPKRSYTGMSSQTYTQQQQYAQNSRYVLHKVGALLRQAMQGSDLGDSYDSDDDPLTLVGKRVRVRWSQEKYYAGVVKDYDETTNMHRVVYDDGDTRDYVMPERVWRFESDAGVNV